MSDEQSPPGPGGKAEAEEEDVALVRADDARILDAAETLTVMGCDGGASVLSGASAELARAVLEALAAPLTRAELRTAIGERADRVIEAGGTTDALVDSFVAKGAVRAARPAVRASARPQPLAGLRPRVVLGLTGAIGTANAPTMVSALCARGYDVRVAMTRTASRFVRAEVLEALTHSPVTRSLFGRDPERPAPHIELAESADAVLVCPASATTLARLASGSFSDIVAAIALTTRAPVLLAPSMNPAMLGAPSVARNLEQLREDGFFIIGPGSGAEVADPPARRRPRFGAAPRTRVVVDLLELVLRQAAERASNPEGNVDNALPADAAAWEAFYAASRPGLVDWDADSADPDIVDAVRACASAGAMLLDVGTGAGATAVALADCGFAVVATDAAASAVARARARHAAARVVWLVDDITATNLVGPFSVAIDRGCLHVLQTDRRAAYVDAISRLVVSGGALVLKVHAANGGGTRITHRFDRDTLARLFNDRFEISRCDPTTFGRVGSPAWLAVLRRL